MGWGKGVKNMKMQRDIIYSIQFKLITNCVATYYKLLVEILLIPSHFVRNFLGSTPTGHKIDTKVPNKMISNSPLVQDIQNIFNLFSTFFSPTFTSSFSQTFHPTSTIYHFNKLVHTFSFTEARSFFLALVNSPASNKSHYHFIGVYKWITSLSISSHFAFNVRQGSSYFLPLNRKITHKTIA